MQVEMEKWNALNWLCAAFLVINFIILKILFYFICLILWTKMQHNTKGLTGTWYAYNSFQMTVEKSKKKLLFVINIIIAVPIKRAELASIFSQPWTDGIHGVIYLMFQTNEEQN